MQLKKKFEQEQSFAGVDEDSAGFDEDSTGFGQGSANYLGSNRILRGSWPHGLPPLAGVVACTLPVRLYAFSGSINFCPAS